MAEIALKTTRPAVSDRGYGFGATAIVEVDVAAAAGTVVVQAPADGVLKSALFTAGSAINATNNYATMALVNKSNSDATMFGTNDLGDGTNTAAYATRELVLGTDAACAVSKGDWLELTTTVQGTVGAATKVQLVFELA